MKSVSAVNRIYEWPVLDTDRTYDALWRHVVLLSGVPRVLVWGIEPPLVDKRPFSITTRGHLE